MTTSFEKYSWQELIDYGITRGPGQQAATAIEAQRRAVEAQGALEEAVRASTHAAVEHGQRLEVLVTASGVQTDRVIDLTEQLRKLTVVITWLTVAAMVFGGIQAAAVVVHFYRWYRGWL